MNTSLLGYLGRSDDRNLEVTVKSILCQSIFRNSPPARFRQQLFDEGPKW